MLYVFSRIFVAHQLQIMENLSVRRAVPADLERIMQIFGSAKDYMRAHGNPDQWNGTYPGIELMPGEIESGHCFVICSGDAVEGTFCLIFGDEPTYIQIENGRWLNEAPYGTIHRLASDGTAKGIGHACIEFCYNQIENLRADTHCDNLTMQRLLEKEGFVKCGIIHLQDRSPRIAYQKSNQLKIRLQELVCPRFVNEDRYRNGHIRIINALPGTKILGVHIPELKSLAAAICKQGKAEATLGYFARQASMSGRPDAADRLCYEEKLLWGLLLGRLKGPSEEILRHVSVFVPYIANWAECDTFCCNAKWKIDSCMLWEFISPYFNSDREFEVRFAVVTAMSRFLEPTNMDRTFRKIASINYDGIASAYTEMKVRPYYVKMGVAWLLATALSIDPEKTRAFVNESGIQGHSLPEDVVKLYIRKARESFKTKNIASL